MSGPTRDPGRLQASDHLIEDLSGFSIRGGSVTAVAQAAKTFVQFGAILLLARLLSPDDFGLVAIAAAVLALFELLRDFGLSAATVQRPRINHRQVSTLFWIGAGLSLSVPLLVAALAPALAAIYGRDEIVDIAVWLAVATAIAGLSTQHVAILRRDRRFAALAAVEIGAVTIGIATAVMAAGSGSGVWSLVALRLAWAASLTVLSWSICGWRPGPPSRRVRLRALLRQGGELQSARLLHVVARNLDNALIGWWAGAPLLVLYDRANKLLMSPLRNADAPLFAVALPALPRLAANPRRYRRAYLKSLEAICMIVMPMAALPIAAPDWLVVVLLGERWSAAAPIVMWLGLAAMFLPAMNSTGWLLATQDRGREIVRSSIAGSALRIAAIIGGLPFGAIGVAAALSISAVAVRMPLLFWMTGRTGPVGTTAIYKAMIPGTLAAVAACAAIFAMRSTVGAVSDSAAVNFALAGALAATAAGLCYLGAPRGRRALRGLRLIRVALLRGGATP